MTKARKDHTCTLCGEPIKKGDFYHCRKVTPWDHPDNETFFTYKAHPICNELWQKEGEESDWIFPDPYDFRESVCNYQQERTVSQ